MTSKPVMFLNSAQLLASLGDEDSYEVRTRAHLYLSSKHNCGQHDRRLGVEAGAPSERVLALIDSYFTSQEQKWNYFSPIIEQYLGRAPVRILDVGSSIGNASITLSRCYPEANVTGFEVESEAVELARVLARGRARCRFVHAPIERLQDNDGLFDFIHCSNVLEHVENPKLVLGRLVASLERGGVILITGPNYLFPWEHHVHCWMLPGGPKPLVKWLLRRRGDRNPSFIDHLRLDVNTWSVKRWLRACGDVEWRDLSHAKVEQILNGDENGLFAPRLVARIKAIHLNGIVAKVARLFPLTPSMVLLVKKPGASRSGTSQGRHG